jgi:spore coat polysaccharide biosynthesis protein SpsF
MATKPAVAIIQARMSSTRLPGKVLKPLAGRPMLWHIVERTRQCLNVADVIVATSVHHTDDAIETFCNRNNVLCHRGSLSDVMHRFLDLLENRFEPYFVRITADCPLIYPQFIDRMIKALQIADGDMVWIKYNSSLLEGQGVHSVRSLRWVAQRSDSNDDREHVGSRYFAEHPDEFKIIGITIPDWLQSGCWRITVDEQSDYDLMCTLYDALWQGFPIELHKAVAWLAANPEIAILNSSVQPSRINQELGGKRRQMDHYIKCEFKWNEI